MSSDIYINLRDVLTQPGLFELNTAYNVGIEDAAEEYRKDEPDYDWAEQCLEPVLTCKFGRRATWRYVYVGGETGKPKYLHVPAGGEFRTWIMEWLMDHKIQYEII